MKLPKWRPRDSETAADTFDSLLTACTVVLLLASLGGLAALFGSLHIGLRVGDILVFRPNASVADSLPVTATRSAALPPQSALAATCTLDPAVMAHGGGSIVVETQSLTKPVYRVHWAGTHTSTGVADCGSSANLTMSRMDLQTLVNAIGGFSFDSQGNVL
ncbi:MAG TPA: hypothetical protein VND19_16805 [Acetobacteraceae bacterium]|nr:hypothetical protein [Acetobacteraceae bacterium]